MVAGSLLVSPTILCGLIGLGIGELTGGTTAAHAPRGVYRRRNRLALVIRRFREL